MTSNAQPRLAPRRPFGSGQLCRGWGVVEVLESYIGTTLSLGLNPTSPSPHQRVLTQEAAGMKKLWESSEKAMKNIARAP